MQNPQFADIISLSIIRLTTDHYLPCMARRKDIDDLLADWPYQPGEIMARMVKAADGRDLLQMRIDLGVLQMEITNRPDGAKPNGAETYFDFLLSLTVEKGDDYVLSQQECAEADREFVQFYHRRICWLALRKFEQAAKDADHTLAFMDFVKQHSPDEEWTLSHEQYRPFVMFHRIQAAALALLEKDGAEPAISEINRGLDLFRSLYEQYDAPEKFEEDEMVGRLRELQGSLREHYKVGRTLDEQLADAVASEQYELAARLRDEISKRQVGGQH